jgi:hypothetical protein
VTSSSGSATRRPRPSPPQPGPQLGPELQPPRAGPHTGDRSATHVRTGRVHTTNAIEALNGNLIKALKTRGHMPSEEAALKLLYLSLRHERKGQIRRSRDWSRALNQFAIWDD